MNALTEARNLATTDIDQRSTLEILALINQEDARVAPAVGKVLPQIAEAVELIVGRLKGGGRVFYFGAGSSGRIGVLDASEWQPTFGTPPGLVQAMMAGGRAAMLEPMSQAEDDMAAGAADVERAGVGARDVVVGITASGRTPYVLAAIDAARAADAAAIGVACNEDTPLAERVDVMITPLVGPEVLAGSTRMKAGTAQKMVLNMLSTAAMIRLGKVYRNLMVDLQADNTKLRDRAERIVMEIAGVDREEARAALLSTDYRVKPALVMLLAGVSHQEAQERLAQAGGRVRQALDPSLLG